MILLTLLALVTTSPSYAASNTKQVDKLVADYFKMVPAMKPKYEAKAKAHEVEIGMPHILFDLIREYWTCDVNEQWHEKTYRHQYVCAGALSKKKVVQGKYFYSEGPWRMINGEKTPLGTLTAIQN